MRNWSKRFREGNRKAQHSLANSPLVRQSSNAQERVSPCVTSCASISRNLGEINLQGSDVTDTDLRFLKGINLTSINLRGTEIVGEGLRYLRQNTKWTHVDLRGCQNLDLKYLAHFKGWKSTSIILTESQWGEKRSDEDKRLLEMANQVICDGQSESICGIQIR